MTTAISHILKHQLVPVFYHEDAQWCMEVIAACYQQGIRIFEFTNRGANALQTFEQLHAFQQAQGNEMLLGAGTIFTRQEAAGFIAAGAAFIVSPCFVQEVWDVCRHHQILYLPGCMTVKEIFEANKAGCGMVKVFPGPVVGPAFVKAVTAVLPDVKYMVTGGVSQQNMPEWLAAGAHAVGASALQNIEKGRLDLLLQNLQRLQAALG